MLIFVSHDLAIVLESSHPSSEIAMKGDGILEGRGKDWWQPSTPECKWGLITINFLSPQKIKKSVPSVFFKNFDQSCMRFSCFSLDFHVYLLHTNSRFPRTTSLQKRAACWGIALQSSFITCISFEGSDNCIVTVHHWPSHPSPPQGWASWGSIWQRLAYNKYCNTLMVL